MRSGHIHFMFSNPWCAWCAPILSGIPCLLSVNLRPSLLFPHIPLIWPTPPRPHAQVRHIYFPSLNFSHNVSDLVWPLVTHPTITSHHFWDLTGLASSHLLCGTQNFEPDVQQTRNVYGRTQERYIEQWLWPGLVTVVYISLTLILVQKCHISFKSGHNDKIGVLGRSIDSQVKRIRTTYPPPSASLTWWQGLSCVERGHISYLSILVHTTF